MIVPKAINGAKGIGLFLSLTNISTKTKASTLEMVIDSNRVWAPKTRPITR